MDNSFNWSAGSSGGAPKPPKYTKKEIKFGKWIPIIVLALVVLVGMSSSFYTVDDKQQAVVTTFGKVTDVTDAGVQDRKSVV